ncbi:MAG TPA: hypothetical protein PLY68_06400 [Myxococcota bacterium]|nr:hypothetical protein [Myxococcota bacterium]HNZ03901.1 hypothetical protein [Myxococcota bacterium]HOD07831.1 hypothetical protein [Myxococcota bacterium]HPB50778.1 hypothetical protein [Myxococcota bacterium]HQP95813.1 hypothetical protein [Myxococcota bacterium]
MKKLIPVIALLALLPCVPASARDMNQKFGIGYEQSLGGVSGINLKYNIKNFQVGATVGFDIFKPVDSDPRSAVRFSVGASYFFASFKSVNMGIGVKVNAGWKNGDAVNAERRDKLNCVDGQDCPGLVESGDVWQVNLEIPLTAEIFLSDHFAFTLSAGFVITILTEDAVVLGENPLNPAMASNTAKSGYGFSLGMGNLLASAGFVVYF